ncbi:hypothetical protein AKJ09_09609 [Labilithrix luteola]|uniref:Uncharacterized protein n=1 Tax=Labilithrix luteola TaxID=1391654 RepID=A0A0K1QAY1_9BACT|nr:hypothetical protein AKJ09_09609 [Labilithrix luteola]
MRIRFAWNSLRIEICRKSMRRRRGQGRPDVASKNGGGAS